MTEKKTKKKATFKKAKEEPKIVEVEEEPVDLPIDIQQFQYHMGVALASIRDAKETLGTSVPYQEFVEELEFADEALIDLFQRTQQLNDLEEVLSDEKFTTQPNVDAQIRKKVIEAITKRFKFVKAEEKLPEPDLIVVNEQGPTAPQVEKPQPPAAPPVEGPSRSLTSAAERGKMRRAARQEALQEMGVSTGAPKVDMYQQVFDQDNAVVNMETDQAMDSYEEEVTPQDLAAFFGEDNVDPEIMAKAESLKAKMLKSGPAPVRGKNRGIQRRS